MDNLIPIFVENLLEIILAAISTVISIIIIPWLKSTAIPFLKEKHLFTVVYSLVKAAEKLAQSGTIPKSLKKEYVIELLKKKGIAVNEEVDAIIEAAVEELDISLNANAQLVLKTIEEPKADEDTQTA